MTSTVKYEVFTSGVADVDIYEIVFHLTLVYGIDTATRISKKIFSRIYSLDMYPNRYKQIEIQEIIFRETIVGKFRIIYSVDSLNHVVIIERVLYTGRNISKIAIG